MAKKRQTGISYQDILKFDADNSLEGDDSLGEDSLYIDVFHGEAMGDYISAICLSTKHTRLQLSARQARKLAAALERAAKIIERADAADEKRQLSPTGPPVGVTHP